MASLGEMRSSKRRIQKKKTFHSGLVDYLYVAEPLTIQRWRAGRRCSVGFQGPEIKSRSVSLPMLLTQHHRLLLECHASWR